MSNLAGQVNEDFHQVKRDKTCVYGLCCRDINASYGPKKLFEDFSFCFEEGVCTCLLGPSGCGKSTLLRLISGSKNINHTGQILFKGEISPQRAVAWMSQKDLLLPWLTVLDNIMLGARLRREVTANLRNKARQMLVDAGMAEYEKEYPSVLSGGMRQRVSLLRTLLEERPVILMDEPFSALDALTRLKLQDLSARLTRGKTVLLVTHDPIEALRLGDRIAVFGGTPVRVVAEFNPGGTVPRQNGDSIIADMYPHLLRILMNGDNS